MRPLAYAIIVDEHTALAAMLRSLLLLLDQAQRSGKAPPFDVLRAMVFYIDEFPERLHHTKETELLFPKLRERVPELKDTLDQLSHDHAVSEGAIRELARAMLAYEMMGDARRDVFITAAQRYVDFYLKHMRLEEEEVMPAALRYLDESDWVALNAAFASNRDPLAGHGSMEAYQPLFHKILNSAPAPVGLG
jgi:hemerythrin-like domain-containing protein